MNQILDGTSDTQGTGLYRLSRIVSPPAFVKSASQQDLAGSDALGPQCYADPAHRHYPCHTAAATWASAGYFLEQREQYQPREAAAIDQRLQTMATYHGIEPAVGELREKMAAFRQPEPEEDLPDSFFALVLPGSGGEPALRRYPLRNAREIKQAAHYYLEQRDHMPFSVRHQYANRVLDRADEVGSGLGETEEVLTRAAGRGACAAKEAAQLLLDRVRSSRQGPGPLSEVQAEMLKLAGICCTKPAQVRAAESLVKLAGVVDQFDRTYGLHRYYEAGLERPEDVLFGVTKQAASKLLCDIVELPTGQVYSRLALERLRVGVLRDCLGEKFASALTSDGIHVDSDKAARVLPALSRDDATLFDRACAAQHVTSWGQTSKASTQELDLAGLAQARRERYPERR